MSMHHSFLPKPSEKMKEAKRKGKKPKPIRSPWEVAGDVVSGKQKVFKRNNSPLRPDVTSGLENLIEEDWPGYPVPASNKKTKKRSKSP